MTLPENRFDFDYAVLCETGLVRKINQDVALALPREGVFCVADGMGGASAGEVASGIVAKVVKKEMTDSWSASPGDRKYTFHQALHQANTDVNEYREKHEYKSMGSTVVAVLFNPWNAEVADIVNCGDSRCYCFRNGELLKLTIDHTLERAFKNNPAFAGKSNVLTNHIGAVGYMTATWKQVSVCANDLFLLCSDGVTSFVAEERIQEILDAFKTPQAIVPKLREAVLASGAGDNFTIVCVLMPEKLPGPVVVSPEEQQESDLLYQIAERRKDYGKQ